MITTCAVCQAPATAGRTVHSQNQRRPPAPADYRCIGCAARATVRIPATGETKQPAPPSIVSGPAWKIAQKFSDDGCLWTHQAEALNALERNENIVVATPTASGKSLIFQLWALHQLQKDPETRTIVFYPTKALANDQLRRWEEARAELGLSPETVGNINGDVDLSLREQVIEKASIIVMTPDVCHAWLTRRTDVESVRNFLANLRNVIIDEAHVYEDVFGSNASYLFRRLTNAALCAGNRNSPRFIAATATILQPSSHMRKLTGQEFTAIGEDRNGTPRHSRDVFHLATNHLTGGPMQNLADLIVEIIDHDETAQVIAFCDSRQGIERIANSIGRDDVLPYRSGYRPEVRRDIERQLKESRIRAVVATSALELGIDMPDLSYGINLDLPQSRKQLLQRMGRIGRSRPGTFVILAHENRFAEHGETMAEYLEQDVELSKLYLDNEYVAYQQALCIVSEMKAAGQESLVPPGSSSWPDKFYAALKNAHGRPPDHLAEIQQRAMEKPPHIAYSLRSSGEEQIEIIEIGQQNRRKKIENINDATALREAYPGAIYYHQRKPYQVHRWARERETRTPFIEVKPVERTEKRTKPIIRQAVTASLTREGIIERRRNVRNRGEIAHLNLVVTESVEGYQEDAGNVRDYRETQKHDPTKSRKQRDFPTTGILLQVREPWFSGHRGEPWSARTQIAQALRNQLSYRCSIPLANIGVGVDNIFLKTDLGYRLSECSIIIYDKIYGGLGLTEDLWLNLEQYVVQLQKAAENLQDYRNARRDSALLNPQNIRYLAQWLEAVNDEPHVPQAEPSPADWWRIIAPQSKVSVYSEEASGVISGILKDPVWQDGVRYGVDAGEHGAMFVSDTQLITPGVKHDWLIWCPEEDTVSPLIQQATW